MCWIKLRTLVPVLGLDQLVRSVPLGQPQTEDSRAVLDSGAPARLRKGKLVPMQPAAALRPRLAQAQQMDQPYWWSTSAGSP